MSSAGRKNKTKSQKPGRDGKSILFDNIASRVTVTWDGRGTEERRENTNANLSTAAAAAAYLCRRVDLDVGDKRHVVRLLLGRRHGDDGHVGGRSVVFCK